MTKDNNIPGVSIDEALNLFLAVTYPQGIPDEVDKEQLKNALRQKIAKDRPGWAKADEKSIPSSHTGPQQSQSPGYEHQNYSQVKVETIEQSQKEQIPTDPEERYFYKRRKEAVQNREQKNEEKRENQVRDDLRKRLISQKKEADKETLGKAVRIRQALEHRLQQVLQTQTPAKEEKPLLLSMQPPNMAGIPPSLNFETKPGKEGARELFNQIKDFTPEEKIRSLREFNQARRSKLKSREDVLYSRRPSKNSKRSDPLALEKEGEPLSLPARRSETLSSTLSFSGKRRPPCLELE